MEHSVIASEPEDSDSEINLTPMLDVVFIMLIFFIVTASFVKEFGIDVNRPDSTPQTIQESDSIVIEISANNDILMDGRVIDPRAVRANLERLYAANPGAMVVIQAHRRSVTDALVQVMNASREAGIYDIAIASRTD